MAALASDWLRYFQLLLRQRSTEFNETWREARSQRPLLSLCFSGRSEKQDGRPGLWLAETFSTSSLKALNGIERNLTGSKITMFPTKFVLFGPIGKQDGRPGVWLAETFLTSSLKPLNGIRRNLTGSKISTCSTKFVFFMPMGQQKLPPWLICQKGGTLYSGERYVALLASCLKIWTYFEPPSTPVSDLYLFFDECNRKFVYIDSHFIVFEFSLKPIRFICHCISNPKDR